MTISVYRPSRTPLSVMTPVRPGLRFGAMPQRTPLKDRSTTLDRWVTRCRARVLPVRLSPVDNWLSLVRQQVAELALLSSIERKAQLLQLRTSMRCASAGPNTVHERTVLAMAHVTLQATNTLNLIPYDVQLVAVRELLQGRFVEMGTGEGKTLTMALAAAIAALDGTPVHVLTASDYLAERDATWLVAFFGAVGLTVAYVLPGMGDDERRKAYQADVVHVTGKQVAFDWMRDRIATSRNTQQLAQRLGDLVGGDTDAKAYQPLLRGLCLAIIDEADSLMIDEARTPLILAAPRSETMIKGEESVVALTLARLLHNQVDFVVSAGNRVVTLTADGEIALNSLAKRFEGLWSATRYRDERVREALTVLHCWHRDRDYVVRDNRIELVDPHTGRAMPDRRLQHGLHRLLELKERCTVTPENDVVASLPFQQFFRSYVRLSGMSGTLQEVRAELRSVYGVDVVKVAPNQPSRLYREPARVFESTSEQLEALVIEVQHCQQLGRPVLVGTRTVEQTHKVCAALSQHSIVHNLLNASQDADEAAVVAEAGRLGQVTVATNMAGRGTDIQLGPSVAELGGLHVIGLAFNDSQRLDRQLAGRAGRQGDPGSCVRFLCLEDLSLSKELFGWKMLVLERLMRIRKHTQAGHLATPGTTETVMNAQTVKSTDTDGYRADTSGMRFANVSTLWLIRWIQYGIEKRHAADRQRALDAASQLNRHVAIGARTGYTP